jgi:hypothetical protein
MKATFTLASLALLIAAPANPAPLTSYATVPLRADLSALGGEERQALVLMIRAADIMDRLFWYGAYGDKDALLAKIDDPELEAFARINYGPWDRLAGNRELAGRILILQGDGDHAGAGALLDSHGVIRAGLTSDLERINAAGIPVDIVFEQGIDVLGLRARGLPSRGKQ